MSDMRIVEAVRLLLARGEKDDALVNALCEAFEASLGREEHLLEAIRLTQEYAQLPAVEGWSWYDVYKRYRPEDAERLRDEWVRAGSQV